MPWVLILSRCFYHCHECRLEKFSATTLTMLFQLSLVWTFSLSISICRLVQYSKYFTVTAGTFTVMAIAGYTTSIDLTRMGSLLLWG